MTMTAKTEPSLSTRERILLGAAELFNAQGIRAVGVDAIAEHTGIAKMTLYKYFESKDQLVEACITHLGERWRTWLSSSVERLSPQPRYRPLAVFDALEEWFSDPNFRGCIAINITLELANREHPACRASFAHKRLCREYLIALCAGAGIPQASRAADELILLLEGAIVAAVIWGDPTPARRAKAAAAVLLEHHFKK